MSSSIVENKYSKEKSFKFRGIQRNDFNDDEYNPNRLNNLFYEDCFQKKYDEIYNFILQNVISKYENISSCDMFYEDMDGNPDRVYYIRYNNDLSFKLKNKIHYSILEDIYSFCEKKNFPSVFNNITILLVKGR